MYDYDRIDKLTAEELKNEWQEETAEHYEDMLGEEGE